MAPFEPRHPLVPFGPSHLTLLETAAALAVAALAWSNRRALAAIVRRPPLALAALAGFAAANLLAAGLAEDRRGASLRFALRMTAMAVAALAVAAAGSRARRPALAGLAAGGLVMAAFVVAEAAAPRTLEPLLAAFREARFSVGGTLRASGPAEHPNLSAAWIASGLVAATGLLASRARRIATTAALSAVLSYALLLTYSRGALVACAAALATFAVVLRRTRHAAAPVAALVVLALAAGGFAWRGEVFRLRLASETATSWYGAAYAPAERTMRLRPGEAVRTRVTVTNTGRRRWTAAEQFHLSCHWYDPVHRTIVDGPRTELPGDVAPGGRVDVTAEITAPGGAGDYLLLWDMVQENASWFSGQGVMPATVPVTVGDARGAAPTVSAALPLALGWRGTRGELWRAAWALWRSRPWTGVGPDNFRWLYGAASGHPGADTRVFANNLLLEVGADTGVLGVAFLVLAMVASAWAVARRAGEPATGAAILALLVMIAVHGCVDYLLAFTGQYLLLAMVVGLAAAPPGPAAIVDTREGRHYAPALFGDEHGSGMRRRVTWIAAVAAALLALALAVRLGRPSPEGLRALATASCFVPTERVGPGQTVTRETEWRAGEEAFLVGWNPWVRLPPGAAYRAELVLYDPAAKATLFVRADRSGAAAPATPAPASFPPGTAYRVHGGATLRLRYTVENAGEAELATGGAGAVLYLMGPAGR